MTDLSFRTNLTNQPPPLSRTLRDGGWSLALGSASPADLVIWEASDSHAGNITDADASALTDGVCNGASLLLTLQPRAGLTPLLLNALLPTAFSATALHDSNPASEALTARGFDETFLSPQGPPTLLSIPYHHDIRPAAAIVRGQTKYERYALTHPVLHTPIPAESDFWSKPLLNRAWTIRAWGADIAASPLLVTGRYGAGKVALLSTSAAGIGDSEDARRFWAAVLRWLHPARTDAMSRPHGAPSLRIAAAPGGVQVVVENQTAEAVFGQLVLRCMTVHGAILPDGRGEFQRPIHVAPHSTSTVDLPLPAGENSALDMTESRAFQVRAGVLSEDGSVLLQETRSGPDLRNPLQLRIHTGSINTAPYAFAAPGPDWPVDFRGRMGAAVERYAFPPGQQVSFSIELCNGLKNIAPLAAISDTLQPENGSVMALNDEAAGMRKGPIDGIQAWSMWTGMAGADNSLFVDLGTDALIAGVVLTGSCGPAGGGMYHNPGAVQVESAGRVIASQQDLDDAFAAGGGKVRISFAPVRASSLVVKLPWVKKIGNHDRQAPWLGEIEVIGSVNAATREQAGLLKVDLVNGTTGERRSLLEKAVRLPAHRVEEVSGDFRLPDVARTSFYRIEADFAGARHAMPLLMIAPAQPLLPLSAVRPDNAPSDGMNVSRGFREFLQIGTGTAENGTGWSTPDDLVWSYSHQFKEVGARARTEANRLYVTEGDMRHYITPWRSFSNGEMFFDVASQSLVDHMRKTNRNWPNADTAVLFFADRWDTGPELSTLHGWQDFVEFDQHLRAQGRPGFQGSTRSEITEELHSRYENEWQAWQLNRYLGGVRALRQAFQTAGRRLVISAQGLPLVAAEAAEELAETIQGMSDDSTWAMVENSVVLTTGRQMGELAYNPVWKISTLLAWGYNSSLLNNWQWHNAVGTTEPSRRHYYNRAWRATVWPDGRYGSLYTFGYSSNAGYAYTMSETDWQQWWYANERHSLIRPEAPIGAGLVISSQNESRPDHIRFNCGDPLVLPEIQSVMRNFRALHEAGISIPFAANVRALRNWKGSAPLILLNIEDFSPAEIQVLSDLQHRGVRMVALTRAVPLLAQAQELFSRSGTKLLPIGAEFLTADAASSVSAQLWDFLQPGLRFPEGTAGYGFRMGQTSFIVVEDWLEKARTITVELAVAPGASHAQACNVNDHSSLNVARSGRFWRVTAPIGSGDALLIALEESLQESGAGGRTLHG